MKTQRTLLVAALSLAIAIPAEAQNAVTQATPRDSLLFSRRMTEWFFTAVKDSMWAYTSDDMKKNMEKPDAWVDNLAELTANVGVELQVVEEKFVRRLGNTQYWRTSKYSNASEPIMLRFAFSKSFQIVGLGMNPASQAPPVDPIK